MMENAGATRRFCPACLAKRSAEKARNRAKRAEWKEWKAQRRAEQELRKAFPHPPKPTAENSIQDVNARAAAAGRTYGQQVEFERRQKELRDRGEI